MTRDGVIVPDETSVLCEGCGYTLDGLPPTGQCPECGLPIAASTGADQRVLPAWEDPAVVANTGAVPRFLRTTAEVVFRAGRFYRTLATRRDNRAALNFARAHWALSAILLAGALSIHARWYQMYLLGPRFPGGPWALFACAVPLTYLFLWGTTRIAARLTAWEAAYRGLRLPLAVVLRGMYYHAAHYLPVAIVAFATVVTHWYLVKWKPLTFQLQATRYLLILCLEVFIAAGYLFKTYWTGMKNTMYANR
jgi:hypothetical protein